MKSYYVTQKEQPIFRRYMYVRVANCPSKYGFLGSLRSVRQIRGVNNALDVA